MSKKTEIEPELKSAWESANDFFSSLLSGRQVISFDKEFDGSDLASLKPVSPAAMLSKDMLLKKIPSSVDKERAFISLVYAYTAGTSSVVSSTVDKDMYGNQTFHRSDIEIDNTPDKLVITGVKLEK